MTEIGGGVGMVVVVAGEGRCFFAGGGMVSCVLGRLEVVVRVGMEGVVVEVVVVGGSMVGCCVECCF